MNIRPRPQKTGPEDAAGWGATKIFYYKRNPYKNEVLATFCNEFFLFDAPQEPQGYYTPPPPRREEIKSQNRGIFIEWSPAKINLSEMLFYLTFVGDILPFQN